MRQIATIIICLYLVVGLPGIQAARSSNMTRANQTETSAAQSPVSHQAIRTQLSRDIQQLAATPRFTSEQYERAVNYVQAQAQAVGLEAKAERFSVRDPWERGDSDQCELLSPSGPSLPLRIMALTNSREAKSVTGELVLVNYFFDKNQGPPPHDFKGRIVFFSRRMQRSRSIKGYADDVVQRNYGASWAARYGAKAVLVRSVQTDADNFPHAGAVAYGDKREAIPAAALRIEDADRLEKLINEGQSPVVVRLNITPRHDDRRQANVLIRIPGTSLPQEVVLIGAHLDSHDITPGAADDAAGVAAVLAVMREFARNPPARTIWLVLFADEEINASGSRAFAAKYKEELSRPSHFLAVIEIDDGDGPPWGLQITSSEDKSKVALGSLRRIADGVGLEADGLALHTDTDANGADVERLWNCYGIPEIAILQDLTKYFDKHHTRMDKAEAIDMDGLEQTTHLLIRIMRVMTSSDFAEIKTWRRIQKRDCPDE